jgi:hypothetical protein
VPEHYKDRLSPDSAIRNRRVHISVAAGSGFPRQFGLIKLLAADVFEGLAIGFEREAWIALRNNALGPG